MAEIITGAELAARALIERKVDTIFSLSGGHITPIYQYLEGSDVTVFDTRHEQSALFMAEAWGKLIRQRISHRRSQRYQICIGGGICLPESLLH